MISKAQRDVSVQRPPLQACTNAVILHRSLLWELPLQECFRFNNPQAEVPLSRASRHKALTPPGGRDATTQEQRPATLTEIRLYCTFFLGLTPGGQRGEGRARTEPKQGLRPRTVPLARQTRRLERDIGARSRGVVLSLRLRGGPWSGCRQRGYRWPAGGAAGGPGGPEDLAAACPA